MNTLIVPYIQDR